MKPINTFCPSWSDKYQCDCERLRPQACVFVLSFVVVVFFCRLSVMRSRPGWGLWRFLSKCWVIVSPPSPRRPHHRCRRSEWRVEPARPGGTTRTGLWPASPPAWWTSANRWPSAEASSAGSLQLHLSNHLQQRKAGRSQRSAEINGIILLEYNVSTDEITATTVAFILMPLNEIQCRSSVVTKLVKCHSRSHQYVEDYESFCLNCFWQTLIYLF